MKTLSCGATLRNQTQSIGAINALPNMELSPSTSQNATNQTSPSKTESHSQTVGEKEMDVKQRSEEGGTGRDGLTTNACDNTATTLRNMFGKQTRIAHPNLFERNKY